MPNNLRSDDENENLREQVDYRIRSEMIQKLYPCVTRANKNENKKKISLIFSGQFEKINITLNLCRQAIKYIYYVNL